VLASDRNALETAERGAEPRESCRDLTERCTERSGERGSAQRVVETL
jgi:hypothetical protein